MTKRVLSSFALAAGLVVAAAGEAVAQPGEAEVFSAGPIPAPGTNGLYIDSPVGAVPPMGVDETLEAPPIPPEVESQPVAGPGGSYCYRGAHPVDPRVDGGSAWHDSQGVHAHFYPPFDLRLFALHDGCYYFVGDPTDFGYRGRVHGYYGAHPISDGFGGGWCFRIGGHSHAWQPWSASFVLLGTLSYWQGPYDGTFWAYWPYYSHYYRSYYPRYYGDGRFTPGHQGPAAPRIGHVPPPGRNWRNAPPTAGMMAPGQAPGANGWTGSNGWHGADPWQRGNSWQGGPPAAGTMQPLPAPAAPPPHARFAAPVGSGGPAPVGPAPSRAPLPATTPGGAVRAPTAVPAPTRKPGGDPPGRSGGTRSGWR